jgi:hypothetical protein
MAKKKTTKGTARPPADELDWLEDSLIQFLDNVKDVGLTVFAAVAQRAETRREEIRRRETMSRAMDTLARVLNALAEPEEPSAGNEGHEDRPDGPPEGVLSLDEFRARRHRPESSLRVTTTEDHGRRARRETTATPSSGPNQRTRHPTTGDK